MEIKNGRGRAVTKKYQFNWHQEGENIVVFYLRRKEVGSLGFVTANAILEVTADIVKEALHFCMVVLQFSEDLQKEIEGDLYPKIDEWFANPPATEEQAPYIFSPEQEENRLKE